MKKSLDIEIIWGGYYASIPADEDVVGVFRLLDFNRDWYHAALLDETFDAVPKLEQVVAKPLWVDSVPIDSKNLVYGEELQVIGSKPLTQDDLEGYIRFLEAHAVPSEEVKTLIKQVIGLSHEPPLSLHLEIVDEQLVVTELK
jgi:hypothetical protein